MAPGIYTYIYVYRAVQDKMVKPRQVRATYITVIMAGFPKGDKRADRAKRPMPGIPHDKSAVESLIIQYKGNLSRTADALGTNRNVIRKIIENDEHLTQVLEDCRLRKIELIEDAVYDRAAESQDTALQAFVLKTQGRNRGWDQSEAQHAAKDIATAAFDFIINRSKNPAEPAK